MGNKTIEQYTKAVSKCRDIFLSKAKDYGAAWRILRTPSLTDQIFIKANRIRTLEEKGTQKIDESRDVEFIGLVNYSAMALIQLELGPEIESSKSNDEILQLYDSKIEQAKNLMLNKNHDYGEAWRDMRVGSFTDLILMKLLRIKQIENNQGNTLVSEGIDANYFDIINYAIFALIKLDQSYEDNYSD